MSECTKNDKNKSLCGNCVILSLIPDFGLNSSHINKEENFFFAKYKILSKLKTCTLKLTLGLRKWTGV